MKKEIQYYHQLGDQLINTYQAVYILVVKGSQLTQANLLDNQEIEINHQQYSVKNGAAYRNGVLLEQGETSFSDETIILLNPDKDIYTTFISSPNEWMCNHQKTADLYLDSTTELIFSNDQVYIELNGNSVYLNSQLIEKSGLYLFSVGDVLVVDYCFIEKRAQQWKISTLFREPIFNTDKILVQDRIDEFPPDFPEYRRSPRVNPVIHSDKIIINQPPQPAKPAKNSLLRAIVPSLGMFAMTALMSVFYKGNAIMMLGMGGFSLLTAAMSMTQYFQDKRDFKNDEIMRVKDYEHYLLERVSQLSSYYKEEKDILNYHQPDIQTLADMISHYDSRIYERLDYNEDFLQISLGKGDKFSQLELQTNFDEQSKDASSIFANNVINQYKMQKQVPITVNVAQATVGLIGTYEVTKTAVYNILLQLATFHSYLDINFINLIPEAHYKDDWNEWRFLPHFKMQERNIRGFVHDARSRDAVLNSFYRIIQKRSQIKREMGDKDARFKPHYVLTIFDDSHLLGHSLNEYLAKDLTDIGVTVIWVKEARRLLPETVTTLVEYKNQNAGQIVNDAGSYSAQTFVPYPALSTYETSVRTLANLKHVEIEKNTIPKSVTFLELYQVKQVEELNLATNWNQADTSKTLAVPIGLRGKDDVVELNLHERAHGPHGLVAGTTGSGKSEILQSYILSLAVHFSPEDVGFLTIDFKGGGMANLFKDLPHMLGSITNLDGASSARALASIKAELHKRQRLFNQFEVNHINGYTKLYKEGKNVSDKTGYPTKPLPHLFLISDEFAELKENEPEFMTELVSIARIGRSLGVHLILATQKPSGVVNDQIWSNSRFKLALKVSDVADSNEIIKTPDAASITEPGRAYLQVGNNEIYELFQSAWSGAIYAPRTIGKVKKVDERIWLINDLGQYELLSGDLSQEEGYDVSQIAEVTELEAIINYIAAFTKTADVVMPDRPWLEPLRKHVVSPSLEVNWTDNKTLSVPFAEMDIPAKQKQVNFDFNLEELGHTVFYGSPGYGKSVALQTLVMNLARANTPEQVQFSLFDFGTNGLLPLKNLPHVVDLTRLDEEEKLVKFLKRIEQELKERKEKFADYNVASLAQYEQKSGEKLPISLTIFDGFDSLKDHPLEETIEALINRILREGSSLGFYVILTALRSNSLKISMSSNISSRIVLFMVDESAANEIIGREALIQQEILGRGQIKEEAVHAIQIYLPTDGNTDIERLTHLESEIKVISQMWTGKRPAPIPMLPREITLSDFSNNPQIIQMWKNNQVPIGFDKESTTPMGFTPQKDGYFEFLYETIQQQEYGENAILLGLQNQSAIAEKVLLNTGNAYRKSVEMFDRIIESDVIAEFFNDIQGEIEGRQKGKEATPMYIFVHEAHLLSNLLNLKITENLFKRLLMQAGSVNIHFIFSGEQKKIGEGYLDVDKVLKVNIPAGCVGTRFQDQSIAKVQTSFKESVVAEDECNFFVGRKGYRLRMIIAD